MTPLLILLLLVVLAGGFGGHRYGYVEWPNPLSIILLVLVVLLLFGIVAPHFGRVY